MQIEIANRSWRASSRHWWLVTCVIGLLIVAVAIFGSGSLVAYAQTEAPAASKVPADEVNVVAREIWCPLCSGVRLDVCELKACEQMREVIAIKLAEGEDTASIKAYFVEQYGPQVLGEPPREGFSWLAWILPVVAVVAGGYIFWRTAKRMVQPTALAAKDTPAPPAAAPKSPVSANDTPANDDEYNEKLEEELAKYG